MGLISEETIQRVSDANDIVDLISSYFPLKRAGTSFRALCPFHREKSPSFHVNPARQNYHCFGCGAGGGVLRFVMEYEHLDFPSAVRRLAQRAGIPIIEEASTAEDHQKHGLRQRLLALHAEASTWFHDHLLKSPDASQARDYLKSRGLNSTIAKSWQLGFAPGSWDALLTHLRGRRFTQEEILQSGLASSKDEAPNSGSTLYSRFRNRVMFPIRNDYGEVIAFSGRILEADAKAAKYVNSPETPLFTKGRVLYGLDKTKRDLIEKNAAIVCEGQIDLISAFEAGIRNVIAPQGTAFTGDQARLLKRYVETVLLCFDSDAAGKKAAARSLPALLSQGLLVKIVTLPQGEDPDSLIRRSGPEAFLEVINNATDFFEHSLNEAFASGELNDNAGKSRLVGRIAPPLALVQDAVLRETILGRTASRLGLPQGAIRVAMKAPSVDQDETQAQAPQKEEELTLSAGMEMLCRLTLTSQEVRGWLRTQTRLDDFEPGAVLVTKLAQADYEDEAPPPSTLLAQLTGAEERLISAMDIHRPTPTPLDRAKQILQGLSVQQLTREIEGLKSRIANPAIPADERQKIQKQILDLTIRVADVRRPFLQA
ncbi:MAG: DNA primase [Spartobacteria bacterium]